MQKLLSFLSLKLTVAVATCLAKLFANLNCLKVADPEFDDAGAFNN